MNDSQQLNGASSWEIAGAIFRGVGNYSWHAAQSTFDFGLGVFNAARGKTGSEFSDPENSRDLREASIVSGVVILNEIPLNPASAEAKEAFAMAYPGLASEESLEEAIQRLEDHPQSLEGLLSGIKGKLMEMRSAELLTETLPAGSSIRLAESPTQPGHDLEYITAGGEVFGVAQVKATQSTAAILDHYQLHPQIPVITTRENAAALGDHPALASHQPDLSHADLDREMDLLAEASGPLDAIPLGAAAVVIWNLGMGDGDLGDRLSAAGETLGRNTPATLAAGLAASVAPWWLVIPVAFGARWITGEGEKDRVAAWNAFKQRWSGLDAVIRPATDRS